MSHANAALTPRARLRLARLIVDDGWPIARAAERYDVSWPTAKRWAGRYAQHGAAAMADRSSRPHRSPSRTPQPVVRKIVHLRWKQRLGPVQIAGRLGMPASTVHAVLSRCRINRLSHIDRATGEAIRRYEHDRPGAMLHVDVKKLGNIPDGGGWRYLGRVQGERNRQATARRTGARNTRYEPRIGTAFVHTVVDDHSRVAYAEIRDDEKAATAIDVLRNAVAWFAERGVTIQRVSATTDRPTNPTPGVMRAPNSASGPRRPAPTALRPTAKSNASTAPWQTAGPWGASTPQNEHAAKPYRLGSITTITTGPTPLPAANHPSPG
ncbi:hypothetical protein GCM10020219_091430 [Nonomuraea dietziae]